jgi:hypothetical protein
MGGVPVGWGWGGGALPYSSPEYDPPTDKLVPKAQPGDRNLGNTILGLKEVL